jgi:hypothetical protein
MRQAQLLKCAAQCSGWLQVVDKGPHHVQGAQGRQDAEGSYIKQVVVLLADSHSPYLRQRQALQVLQGAQKGQLVSEVE